MVSVKKSKFIKSLKIKKYRTKERAFIVEGTKNVLEVIDSDYVIQHILATKSFIQSHQEKLQNVADLLIETNSRTLVELGTFQTNNDCLAIVDMPEEGTDENIFDDHVLALDGVKDPGNLGTIIRTMDWFGLRHLVCSSGSADVYNPKVVNATMGSFTRVRVSYTDLVPFVQKAPLKVYGADLQGIAPKNWEVHSPVILVMGSESRGLSEALKSHLDGLVAIPKGGVAESLNVAIAAGILCHHLKS